MPIRPLHPETAPLEPVRHGRCSVPLRSSDNGIDAVVAIDWVLRGDIRHPLRVVLGGISAGADVAGWWPQQAAARGPLAAGPVALLGIDWIGELPPGWRCVTPQDQAAAIAGLLDALGIERLDAIVGASYGGAVALAFAERFASRSERALVLCAAHRPSPMAQAQRALQRQVLQFGIDHGDRTAGLALARALAMTTYRSEAEFSARFDATPQWQDGRWQTAVEQYLGARGAEFAGRFDAGRYRVLSESLDLHSVDPSRISIPLHLLAIREDRLVPASDIAALADRSHGPTRLRCISSLAGHDGFLTETAAVSRWLRHALAVRMDSRMRQPA